MGNATVSPCITYVWREWGVNPYYECPEILAYEMLSASFVQFTDLPRLWDTNRGISLEDPVVASLITRTMLKDPSKENIDKFTQLYGLGDQYQTDFTALFAAMRSMTQQFTLGGAEFTLRVAAWCRQ